MFDEIINEVDILISMSHPNIVRIYEYYLEERKLIIVMENL